jgi:ribosomal protein S18 acetylase RimI-like enzyme
MARQAITIRDAGPDDAAELLLLWAEMARSGENSARAQEDARQALANIAADPDRRLLVAESEDGVVATMQVSRGQMSPLVLDTVLHTSFLLVRPGLRKQGHGQALMDAALAWAEEKGITQVTAITDNNRETNRFFARLGLSTLGTMRHSSVAGLRKKLTHERGRGSAGRNRHLSEVLAARRSMRSRQTSA